MIWHVKNKNTMNLESPNVPGNKKINGAKTPSAKSLLLRRTVDSARHPPVTRLETTSGKISIFSILIRISPGKAMIIMTSGGRGDMCRSSIPAMEPRKTPAAYKERERESRDTDRGEKESRVLSIEASGTTTLPVLDCE